MNAPFIYVLARAITSNEADRSDGWMVADCVDRWDTTVDYIDNARGETYQGTAG